MGEQRRAITTRGRVDVLDRLYPAATAAAARAWITPFREAFPDIHMRVVDLVAEGDRIAARFTCSAWVVGRRRPRPAVVVPDADAWSVAGVGR